MNFHVLTLFPEMVTNGLNTSILGRAASKGLLSFEAVNIRDYTLERHGQVDDYPYGGGAGMVMQAEPIYRAYEALCGRIGKAPARRLHDAPGPRIQPEDCRGAVKRGRACVSLRPLRGR